MANGTLAITKYDAPGGNVVFTSLGAPTIEAETTDLHLGHTNLEKYIDAVRLELHDLRGGVQPRVQIGYRNSLSDAIVYTSEQTIGEGNDMVFTRLTAKYFRIRFLLSSNAGYFVWAALEFFGAPAGRRYT